MAAVKLGSSSFSCVSASPFNSTTFSQLKFSRRAYNQQHSDSLWPVNVGVIKSVNLTHEVPKSRARFLKSSRVLCATFEDQLEYIDEGVDLPEDASYLLGSEDLSLADSSYIDSEGSGGRPGLVSFYNRPFKRKDDEVNIEVQRKQNSPLWFVGPCVLVASFVFPSLYLRKIISTVFEDSLLTDFLILFFTEGLFYCGVAVFVLLTDHLKKPLECDATNGNKNMPPQLGRQISSVATLVLSLIIPMVTMGLVWPWTGPAASATLAPYLVGIVVQFAFEQYARYQKSPSWPVIPIIFQVYRLHQLNRAAQLVIALSFTVRGAEMTAHNLAINNSLSTLLNVLQILGVICIWSLSNFLMRFFPSTTKTAN